MESQKQKSLTSLLRRYGDARARLVSIKEGGCKGTWTLARAVKEVRDSWAAFKGAVGELQ